jgi:peptide/nickel transport system permease protein
VKPLLQKEILVFKYISRRLATGLLMILAISFLAFMFLQLSAGNVAQNILGLNVDPEAVRRLNAELGVDRPVLVRYGEWLWNALHFNLGKSWTFPDTVSATIWPKLVVTLTIVAVAMTVITIVATVLGVCAAIFGGWIDRFVQFLSLFGFAIPGFLVAVLLVDLFALQFHIFNATGYVNPTDNFSEWVKSIVLPVAGLSLTGIASVSQQIRGSVIDVLNADFVRTLRGRGLPEVRVIFGHVLRNAAAPGLAILGLQFEGLIGGAVIVEQIFAIPGLGSFAVAATTSTDFPSVMGFVMVVAVVVVITNLVVDIATAILNPKVRLQK